MSTLDLAINEYGNAIREGNSILEARLKALLLDIIQTQICQAERLAIIGERERVSNEVNRLLTSGKKA